MVLSKCFFNYNQSPMESSHLKARDDLVAPFALRGLSSAYLSLKF